MRIVSDRSLRARLAALPSPTPRVVASGNYATPRHLLGLVDEALPAYRLFLLNAQPGVPSRDGVTHETPFVGPGVRDLSRLEYLPMRLSLVPRLFRRERPPDVVALHVSRPRGDQVSLGVEVNVLPAAIEAARARGALVMAQVNPTMPYTFGAGELARDAIDLAVEAEEPLASPPERPPSEVAEAIAERIDQLVTDGSTLQVGIGGIPDAVLARLHGRRGLGVWSEMVSDGLLELERQGALDPARPLVASFLFGSPALYEWADGNPRLSLRRTEEVNDPGRIARNPAMTSLNTALEVDLHDQANASYRDGRIYSGFGGQPDFVVGALHAPDGRAIVALPSWHAKRDRSTIVEPLAVPATSFQHSHVVTEQGVADLFGRSQPEQAALLVERTAHPSARESLMGVLDRLAGERGVGGTRRR